MKLKLVKLNKQYKIIRKFLSCIIHCSTELLDDPDLIICFLFCKKLAPAKTIGVKGCRKLTLTWLEFSSSSVVVVLVL